MFVSSLIGIHAPDHANISLRVCASGEQLHGHMCTFMPTKATFLVRTPAPMHLYVSPCQKWATCGNVTPVACTFTAVFRSHCQLSLGTCMANMLVACSTMNNLRNCSQHACVSRLFVYLLSYHLTVRSHAVHHHACACCQNQACTTKPCTGLPTLLPPGC